MKNYQLYVRREIQNQSSLRHPLIVSLREVCPYSFKGCHLLIGVVFSIVVCHFSSLCAAKHKMKHQFHR